MGDDKEHTQRLELDAERTQAALTQTEAPHALGRNTKAKARAALLTTNATPMQKILVIGAAGVKRVGSAHRVVCGDGRGRA